MPIYEYKCVKCNNIFDVMQNIDDKKITKCIHCNGKVKRVYSPAGIIFKGQGFYKTDYKKPKDKKILKESPPKADKEKKPEKVQPKDNRSLTEKKKS
ncbi:MAG: zinc ribbon domain-containing protein [Actinomycetia bacterium]|nr:zinc ribbon domain-containing protein [Actinomycetes bacterium]